jgi:hypothetical protein
VAVVRHNLKFKLKFENLIITNQIAPFFVYAQKVKNHHIHVPRDPTQNAITTLALGNNG